MADFATQITNKDINFITDPDLRGALLDRLAELDRVFVVNAHLSLVFLAISGIEGAFQHIGSLFKSDLKALPGYPLDTKGSQKDLDGLTIEEFYTLLKDFKLLEDVPGLPHIYKLFRDYRNFIHPKAQRRKEWPLDLGQAQMALGLLNATIAGLSQHVFVGPHIAERIAGHPHYDAPGVLHLPLDQPILHSFLVFRTPVQQRLNFKCVLDLPRNTIFNFVFNYANEGDFKMFRLDNRRTRAGIRNSVLHCTQKYFWRETLIATPDLVPDKPSLAFELEIDVASRQFSIMVENTPYTFQLDTKRAADLYDQFAPGRRFGLFNEEGTVRLSQIAVTIS